MAAAAPEPEAGAELPLPFRVVTRRRETHDTWTLELEPDVGRAAPGSTGPVHDALCVRNRRGSDLGLRRRRTARPHGPRRRRRHARDLRLGARRDARSPGAVRQRLAAGRRGRRRRRRGRGRDRARTPPGRVPAPARASLRLRRGGPALRRAHARRPPLHGRARKLAAPRGRPGRGHGGQRRGAAGAARSASFRS